MKNMELTILMPCLNEERTLEICIKKAFKYLKDNHLKGEVLIADNGSTDNSVKIAKKNKARVIHVLEKGYGSALISGIKESYGKYIIMGDCDDSYDFSNLKEFVSKLRDGYDLVMGNRFKGGIEKGAMPFLHRYIGNPILSFLGRLFYHSKIKDFHCGLRGFNKETILNLNLQCPGMEFASEMVVKAEINNLKITEVPTTLKKDGRNRKPHLNTFKDGFRHLKFLIINAPKWLFLLPGILMIILGIIGVLALANGQISLAKNYSIGINTMLYSSSFLIIGILLCMFFVLDKLYSYNMKLILKLDGFTKMMSNIKTYKLVLLGVISFLTGITISIISLLKWQNIHFGSLEPNTFMPKVILANCLIVIGLEIIFFAILINIMKIKTGVKK